MFALPATVVLDVLSVAVTFKFSIPLMFMPSTIDFVEFVLIVPSFLISLTPKLPAPLKFSLEPAKPTVTLTIFDLLVVLTLKLFALISLLSAMSTFIIFVKPA